jgi:hypothetical protein
MGFVHISSIIELEFRCKLWVGDYWSVLRNLAAHGLGRIQCAFDGKGTPDHMAQDGLAAVIKLGAVSVRPMFNRRLGTDLGARCVPKPGIWR